MKRFLTIICLACMVCFAGCSAKQEPDTPVTQQTETHHPDKHH